MAEKKRQKKYLFLIALVLIAAVTLSGVFILSLKDNGKVRLDAEYYGTSDEVVINKEEYEQMLKQQKSFIVTSAATACSSKILDFVDDFSKAEGITYFYLRWSDFSDSSTGGEIKYPPTVFIVSNGKIRAYLDSDSGDDVEEYNNYDDFAAWMKENVEF